MNIGKRYVLGFKAFKSLLLVLMAFFVFNSPLSGQQILPLTESLEDTTFLTIYGVGSLGGEDIDGFAKSPTAQIAFKVNKLPWGMYSFIKLNKGAGLEAVSVDSFETKSLVFPESGNTGILASFNLPVRTWGDTAESKNEIITFLDYTIQHRNIETGEGEKGFDAFTWNVGVFYRQARKRKSQPNQMAFFVGFSLEHTGIFKGSSTRAYREIFENSLLPKRFVGFGGKIGVQFNNLTFQGEIQKLWGWDKKKTDDTVDGITGITYLVTTSVSGNILSF